ncbi:sigma-54-dependent transcriptional regulator [Gynuella sunshinyii]|uniref:Response regulator containing CheY-like receiver, AAA-type ATPase, and DNA-binding domain n=1 Tax=Gynuella sunshinyii YC6258 TaxID=1445510 RepID=A0A0C5VRK7_9GAMM|nr:sigma-54 dependent transcriptional regulator [Gynuella sunshinyii]AJQ97242.1 response regulator containing CheY-like receiver, AAA-type ATPase, and DNA-binding domain [Gynuella sunshinyii YC6258]
MSHILVVEDEIIIRGALRRLLERHDYRVTEAGSVHEATQYPLNSFDLIISDLRLPEAHGTDLIDMAPDVPVLIMTSYASMKSAVDAMKMGAVDYIAKPFDHDEMIRTVERIVKKDHRDTAQVKESSNDSNSSKITGLGEMVGSCPAMKKLYTRILKVAPADITVLIHGESGTGKELAAKAIHTNSTRADAPLVSVNCAAIPESLIESELFGHEKGAFTGASAARQGLVEAAEDGTLFLDEIGELPMEAQARLLRVLQENEVRRVGSVHAKKVNVRLVAATHRNLRQLVKEGRFREDLYYRLQVIEITLPPLRERGKDILEIGRSLLIKHKERLKLNQDIHFSKKAEEAMAMYSWPGNVRELENAVQRALILAETNEINVELLGIDEDDFHIPETLVNVSARVPSTPVMESQPEESPDSGFEDLSLEDYFQHFVIEHQESMSETELAQKLGISRKCLWERRQRLGIPRPKKGTASLPAQQQAGNG